jgi:RecA-family ATPase
MDDENFINSFDVYAAAADGSTGPFNFSEIHLLNLFNQLEGGDYGLVFIDSLKASCMGSDYSIDDRTAAMPMRIIQAMCAKTRTTLVWLHHTNKGSSDSSQRASGSTDLIEIVSSAHELRYNWSEGTGQGQSEWIVQKLRGSSKRKFYYSFDFETGLVLETMSGETPKTSDRIILTIYGSPNKRLKRNDVATQLGLKPKTLSNHATHLKDECLIRSNGTAWELTGKGTRRAKELLQAEQRLGVV